MKHSYLLLLVFTLSLLSCEKSDNNVDINTPPLFPVGKEFNTRLSISPFLESEEQPLSRSTSYLPNGLYAVNVFWKGKGIASFQPYASGLFDNPYNVEIGLIEGYTYRFDCSFLSDNELPYYEIKNNERYYGLPFSRSAQKSTDGFVTNDLLISINPLNVNDSFHQCIYKGEMQIKADSISTHPIVKRYYGSQTLDFTNAQNYPSVSLKLRRAYYSLQFSTDELNPGDSIRIEAKDIPSLYLTHADGNISQSLEYTVSMSDISDFYSGTLKSEENILFTISHRPADNGEMIGEWKPIFTNQTVSMKRNKKNIIKIVNIDKHISDAALSFEESDPMEEEEQEIGK